MGKEYTAKSFKSGNSVAIRMPAALPAPTAWPTRTAAAEFSPSGIMKRKPAMLSTI
jgi:hypothetical protein